MSSNVPRFLMGYDLQNPSDTYELINKVWGYLKTQTPKIKEIMKLTDEMLEDMYVIAFDLYNKRKFKEAAELFQYLAYLDYESYNYAFSLAASYHQLKDYNGAIGWYIIALVNDPNNPLPAHYAAECYLELGQWDAAKFFVDKTIELTNGKEEFKAIREHASLLHKTLEKKITHAA